MSTPDPRNASAQPAAADPTQPKARTDLKEVVSFLKTLSIFLIAAIFLRASVVEAFRIPSGSMIPTLRIGDHILVSKFSYGLRMPFMTRTIYDYDEPRRGDIVVFTRPDDRSTAEDDSAMNVIKRIIGLPGDIVEVRGTQVYINDEPYVEPYARWEENGIAAGDFPRTRVPVGRVFLMGDNRDHSKDSRFWDNHFLEMERIKGRALIIYWSWDSLARIGTLIH